MTPTPLTFWLTTQIVDYGLLISLVLFANYVSGVFGPGLATVQALQWATIFMCLFRDPLYKAIFPSPLLMSKDKLDTDMSLRDLIPVVGNGLVGALLTFVLYLVGVIDFMPMKSLSDARDIWVEAFIILLLFDLVMIPCHTWMHHSAWGYTYIHSNHHSSKKECQAFHAFLFTAGDLFVEFALPPLVLLLLKYAVGQPVSVYYYSLILMTVAEINEHSCNPHSVCYFNPVVDFISKNTIRHTLHHVMPKEYICAGSFSLEQRQRDVLRYEEVFGVDLGYGFGKSDAAAKKLNWMTSDE